MRLSTTASTWILSSVVSLTLLLPAFPQSYVATTLAGADRLREGNAATTVPLRSPSSIAADRAGNFYFVDSSDNRVRRISPSGILTTVAGNGAMGFSGDGGPATQASLSEPSSIAVDASGNLYIADLGNARVRKVNTAGIITTVAGTGDFRFAGDNGPAASASIYPQVIAVDAAGNLYIGDNGNGSEARIRKVDVSGRIATIAGNGNAGFGLENVQALSAPIGHPTGIAVDAAGNVYYSELGSNRIRKLTPSGTITTIAGNGQNYTFLGDNGPATAAQLDPQGLAVDAAGFVYVADQRNNRIRRISPDGTITTVVGTGVAGSGGDGGSALTAGISAPAAVTVDAAGNLYIADEGNGRIRRVAPNTVITTFAGAPLSGNAAGASVYLNLPKGVAVDAQGNTYIADTGNNQVRKVSSSGFSTVLAGTGQPGFGGDGGPATAATLSSPQGIAVDSAGNVYVADTGNFAVRRIGTDGQISTFAGVGRQGYSGDNGPASSALIGYVTSVVADSSGNVYFNDLGAHFVRKVSANGVVTKAAGSGSFSYSGDSGSAIQAGLDPFDLAVDNSGNLYIADRANNRIRRVLVNGTISTVAGNGQRGLAGDGSRAQDAQLASPTGIAVDSNGSLYIADEGSDLIRKVSGSGIITTIAGNGLPAFSGDNGPARLAGLSPYRLAVDNQGNIYVADYLNDRIRKLAVITATRIAVVSGDQQLGEVGSTLANPLVVQAFNAQGVGVAGVPVTFTVTSGSATVVPSVVTTEGDGTAGTRVILTGSGPATIVAAAANLSSVTFTVSGTNASVPGGPQISLGGVVSAGANTLHTLSPNTIASIFGSNFGPPGTLAQSTAVNGSVPTTLAGVCVLFNGVQAAILLVTPGQINFIVPAAVNGVRAVQVALNCGQANEVRSNVENAVIQVSSPEFFYFVQNTNGINPIAAVNATTGVNVGPPGLLGSVPFAPARAGDLVTLYATGLGLPANGLLPGQIPTSPSTIDGPVQISIGNSTLAASDILYAGVVPGTAGLYQINLRVPATVQPGDQPVSLTVSSATAPSGGYLTIAQ